MDIDFVIMWVDGNDPEWRKEKSKYMPDSQSDASDARYRDWELLKYWFRGVEKFAPWVRKIHFVTWGHVPTWLDVTNPKIHIVKHEDYMPKEILPVFNSSVIELYLHKIEGLAEHFVFFNDDVFLVDDTKPEVFFMDGKPVDMLAFQPVVANPKNPVMSNIYMNNSLILAKHFNKREGVKTHPGNYFRIGYPPLYFFYNLLELFFPLYTGFYTVHGPAPFLKKTYEEVWEQEGEALRKASQDRFRGNGDVTQYLFREWQKLSGDFVPRNVHKNFQYYEMSENNQALYQAIRKPKKKVICINDAEIHGDISEMQKELHMAFENILPNKSCFEK
ncbi:MAG: Stealth CR1 domain-containing protein [Eubacteriales bacterium]|nr:Stealth CR1 domain-containing protein [Eubacteriales bacterium]